MQFLTQHTAGDLHKVCITLGKVSAADFHCNINSPILTFVITSAFWGFFVIILLLYLNTHHIFPVVFFVPQQPPVSYLTTLLWSKTLIYVICLLTPQRNRNADCSMPGDKRDSAKRKAECNVRLTQLCRISKIELDAILGKKKELNKEYYTYKL